MSLFGIDIIINNQTGQHAVIDVNAFPGEQQGWVTLPQWSPDLACLGMGEPLLTLGSQVSATPVQPQR